MLPRGRKRRIGDRRNHDFKIRMAREAAIFRVVESVLEVIEAGADVNPTRKRLSSVARTAERGEFREPAQR